MLPGFQPGQILADKYRIERILGAGGMGIVVAATHLALDQRVAIKLMLRAGSPAQVSRFVREARVAARLRSPHVARVLDVDAFDNGTPYMVIEYLDGRDFSGLLEEQGALPVDETVDAVLQAIEAIQEAHSLGIVHRDLKPANLFITHNADGSRCIKVLDFGIAKWAGAGTEKLEATGVMGSAPYMAPEQIAAPSEVDARTDVWALGATLFHLLTGKTPFQYEGVTTLHAMMHAVLHQPPLDARSLRPDLPAELEAVLLRCLEKDPDARFPNMAALAEALAPFGTKISPAAHAPALVVANARTPVRRSMRGLLVGATGLLLGTAVLGAVAWRGREPTAGEPSGTNAGDAQASAAAPVAAGAISSVTSPSGAPAMRPASALDAGVSPSPTPTATSFRHVPQPPRGVPSSRAVPVQGSAPMTPDPLKDELYGRRQ